MPARVEEFRAVGVSKFVPRPIALGDDDVLEQTRWLVAEVLPRVHGAGDAQRRDGARPDAADLASARPDGLHSSRRRPHMIGYVTIGTNDLDRACAFYDALLAVAGARQLMGLDRIKFYGTGQGAMLAVCTPYDGKPQAVGNGNMVAIPGGSREGVDKLYAKAIELGAIDEGAPGERMPIFYGAYVRDLDGNKLCFFDMKTA